MIAGTDVRGKYKLVLNTANGPVNYTLDFKSNTAASLIGKDTVTSKFYYDGRQVRINVAPERTGGENLRLSGIVNNEAWTGMVKTVPATALPGPLLMISRTVEKGQCRQKDRPVHWVKLLILSKPLAGKKASAPKQETILIKNATVWTNEKEGVLAKYRCVDQERKDRSDW